MKKHALCIIITLFLVMFSAFAAADMLEITEVTIEVDDDKQSADEGGGTIDILPDSTLTLKVEVTNNFDSDVEGSEIENIEVEAILEEIDDGDDFEETSDDFDLRDGRDKTVTLEFKIPLRLETDETFKLFLTAKGEDQNNTDHEDEIEFDVDVDKEKHEIRFTRSELAPSKVTCAKATTVILGLINTGEEDEDVELILDGAAIGYNKRMEFEMMEDIDDDENEYEFSGTIDLEDVSEGTYPIMIRALYRDGRESLDDTLNLEVAKCAADEPEPEPTPPPVVTPPPAPEPEPVVVVTEPTPPPTYTRPSTAVATPRTTYTKQSWWSENKWLAIIIIADLILIVGGIIVIAAVLRRRK
jgi:hypothetical protein